MGQHDLVFQSTRPRGARPPRSYFCTPNSGFQSTRPRGARRRQGLRPALKIVFQSTRPRGARRFRSASPAAQASFQSTRPRGARPQIITQGDRAAEVSIHAPAWGATLCHRAWSPAYLRFNPRARVGRDSGASSTRAGTASFQSTRPRGARPESSPEDPPEDPFQSTRPRGARPKSSSTPTTCNWFQSTRPRGARRQNAGRRNGENDVSIHAPAWGAT